MLVSCFLLRALLRHSVFGSSGLAERLGLGDGQEDSLPMAANQRHPLLLRREDINLLALRANGAHANFLGGRSLNAASAASAEFVLWIRVTLDLSRPEL